LKTLNELIYKTLKKIKKLLFVFIALLKQIT